MKNILITGGADFIGSNLSLNLIAAGYQVTVLDNLTEQIHGADAEKSSPLYRSIAGKVNFIKDVVTNINDVKNNQVFNVGTRVATNVLTVVQELLAAYQKNVHVNISGNYRLGDIRHNMADIGKRSVHCWVLAPQ